MKWSYGVTTVESRRETLLPSTLASLAAAGFDDPRLFVDGCSDVFPWQAFGLPLTVRHDRVRTFGNWILTLWELYLREPNADRYAIFQDDFVTVRNLRQYLESAPFPDQGYLNLYTFPENQWRCEKSFRGFFLANQLGKGAVALVFDRRGVETLLGSHSMVMKPQDPHKGHKSVDGAIVHAMQKVGWQEYCHSPSLTQHTGIESSMGNRQHAQARSFPGENFDAMSLLKPEVEPMNEQQALARMIAPGTPRAGKWRKGVIQIWVTRACDKACFGCTQGSNLGGKPGMITPEQFETCVKSLDGYFGVVGMFGGNPAVHPKFGELCEILRAHVPREQRGLWCNNPMGKGPIMRDTFNPAVSNLNVHLDREAYDEFKRDWPECNPCGLKEDSRHSPVYVAMQDIIPDESERWELISNCDINKHWSAMLGVFRGEPRAWFCEIAGAQAMLHQHNPDYPDTGLPGEPGWWRRPMQDFAAQVRHHCHGCGVPLRGRGELACASDETGVEQVSETHRDIYTTKRRERQVQLVTLRTQLQEQALPSMVDYIGNARR